MLLITEKAPEAIKKRVHEIFGETHYLPDAPLLPPELAYHTDLSCCKMKNTLVCSPSCFLYLKNQKLSWPLLCGTKEPTSGYPNDIAYNAAEVGDFLFCFHCATEPEILKTAGQTGMKILDINQGYAKCSIIPVTDRALITADQKIAEKAEGNGLDFLLTTNDGVYLKGFSNGLIGGASVSGNGVVFFTGDITRHRDFERIQEFCRKHKKELCLTPSLPLYDLGSPVFLENKR